MRLGTLALLALALSSCALVRDVTGGSEPRGVEVPVEWSTWEPVRFERYVEETYPTGGAHRLSERSLAELEAALERRDPLSVRAAVLLARSSTDEADELLLASLEQRVQGPERNSDAGDVVAAAALAGTRLPRATERLAKLASGSRAHPDLEVRVECAATLLRRGDASPVPFLIEVLRIGTWAGREDPLELNPGPTTAWARGRAAVELSRFAGVPCTYDTEASIADREREATRLEALLAES